MGPKPMLLGVYWKENKQDNKDTRIQFPHTTFHAVHWYLNGLEFYRSEDHDQLPPDRRPVTPWAVIAIDFLMSVGSNIESTKAGPATDLMHAMLLFQNIATKVAQLCDCTVCPEGIKDKAKTALMRQFWDEWTHQSCIEARVRLRAGEAPWLYIMALVQRLTIDPKSFKWGPSPETTLLRFTYTPTYVPDALLRPNNMWGSTYARMIAGGAGTRRFASLPPADPSSSSMCFPPIRPSRRLSSKTSAGDVVQRSQ